MRFAPLLTCAALLIPSTPDLARGASERGIAGCTRGPGYADCVIDAALRRYHDAIHGIEREARGEAAAVERARLRTQALRATDPDADFYEIPAASCDETRAHRATVEQSLREAAAARRRLEGLREQLDDAREAMLDFVTPVDGTGEALRRGARYARRADGVAGEIDRELRSIRTYLADGQASRVEDRCGGPEVDLDEDDGGTPWPEAPTAGPGDEEPTGVGCSRCWWVQRGRPVVYGNRPQYRYDCFCDGEEQDLRQRKRCGAYPGRNRSPEQAREQGLCVKVEP